MKFFLEINNEKEPSVTVVCSKVTDTVTKIERLCVQDSQQDILYGYYDDEIVPINILEAECFYTNSNKVYCLLDGKEYSLKLRLKQIIELVDDSFIKINQGCIVSVKQIKKFKATLGGTLKIELVNGFSDYVARRELVNVKRRFGL